MGAAALKSVVCRRRDCPKSLAGVGSGDGSPTVKDLVTGSDLRFQDRGPAELKGVPGEWHLYALDRG